MNYKKHMLLILVFIVFLCSCSLNTNKNQTNSQVKISSQYDNTENCLNNISDIYKQGENFKILSNKNQTMFYYQIKDGDGYIIDEGYHGERGSFDIYQHDKRLTMNYGYGGNVWYERYYDISSGRISRFFERPIQTSGELVAYFVVKDTDAKIVLIVQNMFDKNYYYQEISRDFSDYVIKNEVKGEFLENNTKLKISYWITPNDQEVTEMIDLV